MRIIGIICNKCGAAYTWREDDCVMIEELTKEENKARVKTLFSYKFRRQWLEYTHDWRCDKHGDLCPSCAEKRKGSKK